MRKRLLGEMALTALLLLIGLLQLRFTVAPACVSLFGGVALLFRVRKLARWALIVEGAMGFLVALVYAYIGFKSGGVEYLIYVGILLAVALSFFLSARWLSRLDD